MYRRTIISCVALALLFTAAPLAAATPQEGFETKAKKVRSTAVSDGALTDDPALTPELEAELDRLTKEKDAAYAIDTSGKVGAMALNSYGLQTRPVSNFRQEETYWCGPAAVRQSLSFHKAFSRSSTSLPSQRTLADKISTTSSGSSTVNMVGALNSYNGVFGRVWYLASDITDTNNPHHTFVNRIGTMLRSITVNPTAPTILTQTRRIDRYKGTSSRHYMTVNGIDDRTSPMKMRSVDPHYNSAYYGARWENVGSTTVNGLCRATYQADLDGSNRVMAW